MMANWQQVLPLALGAALAAGCKKPQSAAGPAQMPPPQVVVAEARVQRVVETLSQVANIQANEMIEIKAEADGIVHEIRFEEGRQVNKGDLLVRLDEAKFTANLALNEANFKLAQTSFERARQLYEDKLIPRQEFDQAAATFQASEANLDFSRRAVQDASIYAPFEGIMGARQISPGQLITKNTIVSWLIDLDPVKVEFNIPERFLGQVAPKQQIDVKVEAFPKETFRGEVFFVSPFVDPVNRTALIKAEIPNPKLLLRPGMFGSLDLTLTIRENAVVIPETAVSQSLPNSQALLFVVGPDNIASLRKVRTGVRLVGAVEVLEGLQAGEKVVIEGLQKVVPGAPVRLAPPPQPAAGKPS